MKKILAFVLAAALLFICLPVSAADASVVFTLEGTSGSDTAVLSVNLSANLSGISAAAINIIYDYKAISLVSYENGRALDCDIVSVTDNGFGQIRFAFCNSAGYFRSTGELLRLTFRPIDKGKFDSVVYIKIDNKSVFDANYREAVYSSVPGTLSFAESAESFTSDIYTIDTGALLITGIPPQTPREEFLAAFGCPVTVYPVEDHVINGSIVTAVVDDVEYVCTAIVMGDLNCNAKLDSADYIILRRALLRIISPTDLVRIAGDMNGNGSLDTVDYIILRRKLLGMIE